MKSKYEEKSCHNCKHKEDGRAYNRETQCYKCITGNYPYTIPSKWEPIGEEVKATKSIILTSKTLNEFDPVKRPQHYADRKHEVIDVIQDSMPIKGFEGFLQGNIIKYILRYDKKGGVQDLKKARYYLDKQIELLESKEEGQ